MSKTSCVKNPTTWLRISYWVGAIADGLVAIVMFSEAIFAYQSPVTGYLPETPYRYAMALAGSLMLGWTLLLLWADRRPADRRGVLLLTDVVILGLMGGGVYAVAAGFMPLDSAIPILVFQTALFVLFTFSYILSKRTDEK